MGECRLDHSTEDVRNKLAEQTPFLPPALAAQLNGLLTETLSQETLNELFHLLKKYDLATPEERIQREEKMAKLVRE
ncbi:MULTISPECIES: hypothetical protein [Brevibacillus]|jgi:hypothetical protein|uniref:Group-specific protein n=1 Tax=Brevibacillus borstelensis AK1 TaxID=1300222 RepID=M8E686_9BACL|nr:hypothetical protein [Brevibacillus borstelensis]EMT50965.1 hypothetical protein I532_20206 [Brevibacillus borstelensis AK1]KKX53640.1 50S ribosomal protein L7ae [Brevibacillus borstelensis cifa_chp40]MBE5394437.1 50S ribosomal protein L7ae [Brevibacillus borstelensis]MCC0564095.1 hypothetical protein [Brevibacillus borstelensis]MCM3470787.1 hypothetical protein [Brevibacillus borstelensis]